MKKQKIKFKDLSGWLKLAVIYVYVELGMVVLALLFLGFLILLAFPQ